MSNKVSPIQNHAKQREMWLDKTRFKVLVAGRRFGKTIYFRERLLAKACVPGSLNWYAAPTRADAKSIMWESLKERAYELNYILYPKQINETDLSITLTNKAIIQLKTAQKPRSFRGRGVNYIALDEASEYDYPTIWSQDIRPSLSDKFGEAEFGFTPKGFNWTYDIFNQAKTSPGWSVYQFKTVDSPFFQTQEGLAELQDAKANLSERDFKQEYEASFENFAGRIYYAFDRAANSCHTEYNPSLPVIIGMDFNRSPMTACVFQKYGNDLHQIDEIFLRASDTPEMCRVIKQRYPSSAVFVRPDATGSRSYSVNKNLSDHQILRDHGFTLQCAAQNPGRVDRWASVNRATEKRWVKINVKKCPNTVKDLEVICYKEGTCEPMLTDPMLGHIADAFGYAVYIEYPIIRKVTQSSWF